MPHPYTQGWCGSLTAPQALRLEIPWGTVMKPAGVWKAPGHTVLSPANLIKNLLVTLSGSLELGLIR
eukprot:1160203-Pelagomonas_calceolata.AAC.5